MLGLFAPYLLLEYCELGEGNDISYDDFLDFVDSVLKSADLSAMHRPGGKDSTFSALCKRYHMISDFTSIRSFPTFVRVPIHILLSR